MVDDGSTDSSGIICEEYAKNDSRIKVLHQTNGGVSNARNNGFKIASGDFILFPDGDDVLDPRMIETLYNLIISGDYDFSMCYGKIVYSAPEKFDESIDFSKTVCVSREDCIRDLFVSKDVRRQFVSVWNKLYRRSLIEKIDFSNTATEDLYYNCLVYLRMNKAIMIPQTLYYYIQRNTSITHQGIDKRWVKDLDSMKNCLDSIPVENSLYRSYCLRGMYKRILSTRLWSKGTPNYKLAKEDIREIKNQTFREFLFNSYITIFDKLVFLVFYYCPILYRLFIGIMEFRAK